MSNSRKINVLQFICPTGFYGAERWILALAKHLPKDTVRCDLAVTHESNSQDLELVKIFRDGCGEAFELPMSIRFDFGVINKLVNLIEERNIHIIHTHGYKSDILGVIAARKAGIKCIVTPHGFENSTDLKLRLFIWLGCKAMLFADVVAPLSPQLMLDSKKIGVSDKKLFYIQNGVDLSEIEEQRLKKNPLKNSSEKRIGFIGQLISRKNLHHLLDIFNALASKHKNVRLFLIGDGDQKTELELYVKKLSNSGRIEFLGFRDDRLDLLQSFDLFVMTSTLEGIPRCLMEACAMEVPVAAYNIPGIDKIIKHRDTGLLANLNDKEELLNHWEELLFNEGSAKTLAAQARKYVQEHYSAQRMSNEYLDLYDRILNS